MANLPRGWQRTILPQSKKKYNFCGKISKEEDLREKKIWKSYSRKEEALVMGYKQINY